MVNHTIKILEFEKITDSISQYCLSEAGKKLLLTQKIETDYSQWKMKTDAVFSIKKIFEDNLYFPDSSLPDIAGLIKKVSIEGTVLDSPEIASVMNYLQTSSKIKKHLYSMTENALVLKNLDFAEVIDLVSYLSRFVRNDGVFRDENVKELQNIRNKIGNINKTINRIVTNYTNDPVISPYLQENSSTIRDSRIVLPVRENFRGKIKGIVHGSSSRGMTLFVEPVELFEHNNEIIELEERYRIEIHRILRELTGKIRENHDVIEDIFIKITFLDTIIARARFAYLNKSVLPEISGKGIILKNARHFLLGSGAVPVDIIISNETKALLISGPNTGGKTLALKTAGLSALMNQFCTGVLADEGSSISIFDNVLADIGDEQSIAGSLSTFSAHMKNISEILNISTEKSLVLLDEPGTGTDPDEGAALSMAVFDILLGRGTVFLATTHQGTLKNYAAGRNDVANVSVAYDRETYKPEYRIVYGLPGESFGIDIALKSGVDSLVISKARDYLGSEKININKLLKEISIRQQDILEKENKLENAEKEAKETRRIISLRELSIRQKEYEVKNIEKRAINSFLKESRQRIENIIKNIIEHGADEASRKEARDFIDEIQSKEENYESAINDSAAEYLKTDEILPPGTDVYIGEGKKKGEIIRVLKNKNYLVSVGSLKMEVDRKEICLIAGGIKGGKTKENKKAEVLHHELNNTDKPVFELDLRGMRIDEAMGRIEKQFDSALINGLPSFSIIHGYGEGILKNAVAEYLAKNPAVKKYYYAHPDNGGFGKTIIEL